MKINDWHAHLYFPLGDGEKVKPLTERVHSEFGFSIGRIWDKPVGPHPVGSCQITVPPGKLDEFIPWLIENRRGVDIFLHPNTGNDLKDHTDHVIWVGKSYDLNTEMFNS